MPFRDVLLRHASAYPLARPEDFLKVCYQGEFGAEHLLADPAAARRYLAAEYESAPAQGPLCEDVGGAFRLHLGPARREGLSSDAVWALFAAARPRGSLTGLAERIDLLSDLTEQGEVPFSPEELAAVLGPWRAAGCPPMHHSAAFRSAYHPAYRVIDPEEARLLPLLCRIAAERPSIVAVDGRCGSGKSTVASLLSNIFSAPVVHMDDFFLPPVLRTPERLSQPGGNVHHERFAEEVLPGLRSGAEFSYRVFSCARMDYDGVHRIPAAPLRIVEGSYSHHPAFGSYADLTVFVTASEKTQLARIAARDGEAALPAFRERWIPLEEAAFAAFQSETRADVRLETDTYPVL